MSRAARWLPITLLASAAAFVMAVYAPALPRDGGWAPEASRSVSDARVVHA